MFLIIYADIPATIPAAFDRGIFRERHSFCPRLFLNLKTKMMPIAIFVIGMILLFFIVAKIIDKLNHS